MTVTPDVEALEDYVLAKLGKYDKRIDRLAREPRDGEEWYERAYNLYHNDRYAEAAEAFKRAASEDYRPATALYNAACSYALLGQTDQSIATLKEAIDAGWDDMDKIADDSDFDPIRSDPKFASAMRAQGGEIATRRVAETMERYNGLREGKTDAQMREQQREREREHKKSDFNFNFNFDFKDKDKDKQDWFEVGLDLLRLRRLDESIDAFQRAIQTGQRESTAMYNLACAYSLKGDAASGMNWLEKAIDEGFGNDEKMRNDPDIALLRSQPRFEELRRRAKDFEMHMENDNWGRDDDDREHWAEAAAHHRQMTQKYPNAGRPWFNLGFTALQARDFDTALGAFQHAIQLNHRVPTSTYNVACVYAVRGDNDNAFAWLQKARDAGFDLRNYLFSDDDLDSLHDDPRWDALRDDLGVRRH
jgi:tetratricopeptide (TPR) repeat protein